MVNGYWLLVIVLAFYLILYSWYGPFIQLIISRIRLSRKRLSLSRATTALPSLWQCKINNKKGVLQIFRPKTAIFEGYFSPDFYEKIRERLFDIHYSLFTSEAPVAPARVLLLKDTLLGSKNWTNGLWTMDVLVIFNCADAYGKYNIIL